MKLFVYPNLRTEKHTALAVGTVERFCALNDTCSMSAERCKKMYGDTRYALFSPEEADVIVAIGGDGSVLHAAKLAVEYQKPLLGVNSGRLGFLCALDAEHSDTWSRHLWDTLTPSPRTLLSFYLDGACHYALNDVVIAKSDFGESMELEVSFCKESHRYCGDGLVIATPTGSTAYNLSAGGALVHTEVPALIATPICPHDGRIRSKVLPQSATVGISLHRCAEGKAQVYADGEHCGSFGDTLQVQAADKTLTLLTRA